MRLKIITLFSSFLLTVAAMAGDFFNVRDYGATGDGYTLDTKAINAAIQGAIAKGGGTVYIPAGNYLTGSIRLQNNITLFIDRGAVLIAAPLSDSAAYDAPEPALNQYQDYGHSHFRNSLIWGEHLHDISVIGSGMIWGRGLVRNEQSGHRAANKAIALLACRNVLLRDFTVSHGGWFGILATGTDNLTIDNLLIDTNRDGMDIDCCQQVHITNCTVNSPGDDGICLKSSFALGYARASRDITITNCHVSGFIEGSVIAGTYLRDYKKAPTGRIKMGTESNGGFQNIAINNCVFDFCRGLALETVDGALLEDIVISNITMRDVTNSPIFIRLGARMRAPDSLKVGVCRRILISQVNVYTGMDDSSASIISGIPGHDIEDLEMRNIHIWYKGGGIKQMAAVQVPEFENRYPEPNKFGVIPAYGFFIRHVNGLKMRDITVSYLQEDQRPPFILNQVSNADLSDIRGQHPATINTFLLQQVAGLRVQNCEGLPNSVH